MSFSYFTFFLCILKSQSALHSSVAWYASLRIIDNRLFQWVMSARAVRNGLADRTLVWKEKGLKFDSTYLIGFLQSWQFSSKGIFFSGRQILIFFFFWFTNTFKFSSMLSSCSRFLFLICLVAEIFISLKYNFENRKVFLFHYCNIWKKKKFQKKKQILIIN